MKTQVKKREEGDISRIEASGEVKEILINKDFFNPKKFSVSLCFRGDNTSGIVELSFDEVERLKKELAPKKVYVRKKRAKRKNYGSNLKEINGLRVMRLEK